MNMRNHQGCAAGECYEADVAIVGAGIAGATIAYKLASPTCRVLLLDAGPRIDRVTAVNRFKASPTKGNNSPYPVNPYAPDPDDQVPQNFYVQAGPVPFTALYMKVVGGTTWHMTAHAERFQESDFRLQSRFQRGVDWPVSYQDLLPAYVEAEKLWGVSGNVEDTIAPPRYGEPYPMPALKPTYLDRRVKAAIGKLGLEVALYPHGRNSVPYDNRPACCGNANCNAICPVAAKYDASVHVTKAEEKGARVLSQCVVDHIDLEKGADGKARVSGLSFVRADGSGGRGYVRATVYVVAAHAIETPKLLLLSKDAALAPTGVANSSGAVGRYLMTTMDLTSTGQAKEPLYPWRGPVSATSGLRNFRDDPKTRGSTAAFATFILNGYNNPRLGPIELALSAISGANLVGKELATSLSATAARSLAINSSVEVLPSASNTVVPDEKRDLLGQPLPRVSFDIDDYTRAGIAEAQQVHGRILKHMGDDDPDIGSAEVGGAIIAGTARMGSEAASSVVDKDCRSWDHDNLFVVGNCNFPTVSIASPSLTTTALALRAAQRIKTIVNQG